MVSFHSVWRVMLLPVFVGYYGEFRVLTAFGCSPFHFGWLRILLYYCRAGWSCMFFFKVLFLQLSITITQSKKTSLAEELTMLLSLRKLSTKQTNKVPEVGS